MRQVFLMLAFFLPQVLAWGQESFIRSLESLKDRPNSTINSLVDVVTDPQFANQLNPKEKTGKKNIRLVFDQLVGYSQAQHWATSEQIGRIFKAFADQGINFKSAAKNSVTNALLANYVYAMQYKYQNIGVLIYENILQTGYDPYFVPERMEQSMFDFALARVKSTSYYLDKIIKTQNLNQVSQHLGSSPFIYLASNLNENNLLALDHIILYDKDLNIDERTEDNKTSAFDRAIAFKNISLAEILIKGGVDLLAVCDACAAENYLHRIALYDSMAIFKILPPNIVSQLINKKDVNGKTPIFWALENGQAAMAIAFARAGANLQIKDKQGLSVMDIAWQHPEANQSFINSLK